VSAGDGQLFSTNDRRNEMKTRMFNEKYSDEQMRTATVANEIVAEFEIDNGQADVDTTGLDNYKGDVNTMTERQMIAYAMQLYRDGWDSNTIVNNVACRYNVSRKMAAWILSQAKLTALL
jgi:hypothetical protein